MESSKCEIIKIAVPYNRGMDFKETEQIEKIIGSHLRVEEAKKSAWVKFEIEKCSIWKLLFSL